MVEEEPDSWGALYDEQYAGSVLLINNSRDALAAALFHLGYSVNRLASVEAIKLIHFMAFS